MLRWSLSAGLSDAGSFLLISAIFSRSCAIFPSFWFWLLICASFQLPIPASKEKIETEEQTGHGQEGESDPKIGD
jgi:hypothetical protein